MALCRAAQLSESEEVPVEVEEPLVLPEVLEPLVEPLLEPPAEPPEELLDPDVPVVVSAVTPVLEESLQKLESGKYEQTNAFMLALLWFWASLHWMD